jgi:nucleoside 2-deoxyribosyltransferase
MIKSKLGEKMNIYFSCSITGGRKDEKTYQRIVNYLLKNGHKVPTAHLALPGVLEDESDLNAVDVYQRDMKWVRNCDVLIAEVSTPSHGVGYEIAAAIYLGKHVMCCYHADKKISKIISGNTSTNVRVLAYKSENELISRIDAFLREFSDTK